MLKCVLFGIYLCVSTSLAAQDKLVQRIDPPNWWIGMEHNELQLLLYGTDIAAIDEVKLLYDGVVLKSVTRVENSNYIFLNLSISQSALPGEVTIDLIEDREVIESVAYPLRPRSFNLMEHQGFGSSDVIYLLMPDRFANGDPSNDSYEGMTDVVDRTNDLKRHGGDLQGIIDHLDYIADLGATAIWLNPALENDMPKESYHGYAITDMYRIDRRLGNNDLYRKLVRTAHGLKLKVIMDFVVNHIGTNNYLIKDLPMTDWIHQYDEFTRTNYRGVMQLDPYAAQSDLKLMNDGWFDHTMADLNQQNPMVSRYLIQNTLWWIEYSGIDGIRMDTYSYPDKDFLALWARSVMREYPNFNIVGEVWENRSSTQAFWLSGANKPGEYDSELHCLTDFVLRGALTKAFRENESWDTGLPRIYYTLTEDRLYPDAHKMVTFIDNHDVPRYFTEVGEDIDNMKMGLTALLTLRGIPQLYYGSELAFTGGSHGEVRPEMKGGWDDHESSAFTGKGLSGLENDIFDYTRNLLQWRKKTPVIHEGKLMQFVPEKKTYVYFRYNEKEAVMVAFNRNEHSVELDLDRFKERLTGYTQAMNVINGGILKLADHIVLPAESAVVLELQE